MYIIDMGSIAELELMVNYRIGIFFNLEFDLKFPTTKLSPEINLPLL